VLGEGLDLAALVDEAIQARILLPDDRSQVRFAHDVFREVLVAGIPASARRRAHEDLGHALDLARAAGVVVHPAELAGHFAAAAVAGDSAACERAVLWAREAAADASARLAFEDAVVHLERALAVVDAAPSYWDQRPALLLAMADARRLAGHLGAAATTYREVLSGARRVGDPEPAARPP
jgi:hypothetical protein